MNRILGRVLTVAGVLALTGTLSAGALDGLAYAGSGLSAHHAATAAAPPVVVVGCAGAEIKFRDLWLGCAGNEEVAHMSWSRWGSTATGAGVLRVNRCVPDCAQGTFAKYPIHVRLHRARTWPKHHGQQFFTRLTWTFTHQRPRGAPRTQTVPLENWA